MARIDDAETLRRLYGEPGQRAVAKQMDRLDRHCRDFIALSPFLVLATQGADGLADATPRGDAPGFVAFLDDTTLALPDRPGNRRLDSLTNVLANPAVGIIFLIPGVDETLRVNGLAEIRDDAELKARFAVDGREPATVLVIRVREVYLHCAKALMRSRLWSPESVIERSRLPSMGEMLKDHTRSEIPTESQDEMVARYREQLY